MTEDERKAELADAITHARGVADAVKGEVAEWQDAEPHHALVKKCAAALVEIVRVEEAWPGSTGMVVDGASLLLRAFDLTDWRKGFPPEELVDGVIPALLVEAPAALRALRHRWRKLEPEAG